VDDVWVSNSEIQARLVAISAEEIGPSSCDHPAAFDVCTDFNIFPS
jgi:hypothetical protein